MHLSVLLEISLLLPLLSGAVDPNSVPVINKSTNPTSFRLQLDGRIDKSDKFSVEITDYVAEANAVFSEKCTIAGPLNSTGNAAPQKCDTSEKWQYWLTPSDKDEHPGDTWTLNFWHVVQYKGGKAYKREGWLAGPSADERASPSWYTKDGPYGVGISKQTEQPGWQGDEVAADGPK